MTGRTWRIVLALLWVWFWVGLSVLLGSLVHGWLR